MKNQIKNLIIATLFILASLYFFTSCTTQRKVTYQETNHDTIPQYTIVNNQILMFKS